MPYGPYNLLSCRDIPVTVSKAFKRVWIRDNSKDEKNGLAGLGEFEHGDPILVRLDSWRSPPITDAGIAELKGTGLWEYETAYGKDGPYLVCTLKTHFRHKCDRLLLVQNCVLVEGDGEEGDVGTYRIAPGPMQWFAPTQQSGTRPVSGEEASVRPWCGPKGDIDGWKGSRYADFAPLVWVHNRSLHPYNDAAAALLNEHSFSELPAAWGIGDPPRPLYKVDYDQPFHRDSHGHRVYDSVTDEAAEEYVQTHRPTRVLFWEKYDGSGSDETELANKAESLFDWDSTAARAVADTGISPGIAFDAEFFVSTWKLRSKTNSPGGDYEWTKGEEGLLQITTTTPGHITISDYTDGPLSPSLDWRIVPGYGWEFWGGAIRVVKPLPPIAVQGGGA